MGKIDDMRRRREGQHAGAERVLSRSTNGGITDARGANADVEGRCSECGKLRALQNGLVIPHQKGLGKACPGSRKAPA